MANNVLFVIQAVNKFSKVGEQVARSAQRITDKIHGATKGTEKFSRQLTSTGRSMVSHARIFTNGARQIATGQRNLTMDFKRQLVVLRRFRKALKATGDEMVRFGRKGASVGQELTLKLTAPIAALGTLSVVNAAKMESLGISFRVMTGSAEKGAKLFKEMTKFAATTPFKVDEVMDATKMLLSYTVQAEDMNGTMRMLGDLAAGTGKPLKEFALVFGQVKAKGRLMGQEVLQMAEKGIAVSATLAKMSGKSQLEITKMIEKGQVSFKDFEAALKHLTTKGGTFFNLTHTLSKSTAGLFAQLQGEITLTTATLGRFLIEELGLNEMTKSITDSLKGFREGFAVFREEHPHIAQAVLVLGGILAIMGPIVVMVSQAVLAIGAMTLAFGLFGGVIWAALAPILLIIAAIALVATAIFLIWKNWRMMWEGLKSLVIDFGKLLWAASILPLKALGFLFSLIWEKLKVFGTYLKGVFTSIKESLGFSGKVDVVGSSKTQVDINLSDPGNMVKETKTSTQSSGTTAPMNIGVYNMG